MTQAPVRVPYIISVSPLRQVSTIYEEISTVFSEESLPYDSHKMEEGIDMFFPECSRWFKGMLSINSDRASHGEKIWGTSSWTLRGVYFLARVVNISRGQSATYCLWESGWKDRFWDCWQVSTATCGICTEYFNSITYIFKWHNRPEPPNRL